MQTNLQTPDLKQKLEHAIENLERSRPFNKARYQHAVLDLSGRLLAEEGGITLLYELAPKMDQAGLFHGTDWAQPAALLPGLVKTTLEQGEKSTVVLEILSELRMVALANEACTHEGFSAEHARHFVTQVMALNLQYVFGNTDEATRVQLGPMGDAVSKLFSFMLEKIGFEDILGHLIEEIWRILSQRPIQVDHIKMMVTQIAIAVANENTTKGESGRGADRLISALFGPTLGCQDDPGAELYEQRLAAMDRQSIQREAYAFPRAMLDVGLVSDYHVILLQWLIKNDYTQFIPDALGLSSTGLDAYRSYEKLMLHLIEEAIHIPTAQSIYGLTMMLEGGILYFSPIAPALWRQSSMQLSPQNEAVIIQRYGDAIAPKKHLLAGIISILGQPLGIGQGNNPTCQSARAISMWAYNDPDYLLHLIAQAARFDNVVIHFEGQPVASSALTDGMAITTPLDTDAVSLILVPHLDRIYFEMGRRCVGRLDDPHRWINPELHGWWVGREFKLAVDVATGKLKDYDHFIEQFYSSYHPSYNGNQPIIHPQPAGLAVTDSKAQFVGWHAITLIRVASDQEGVMRIYFFNPNNDSGQNWGNGVVVSTQGYGERYGESSLPFAEMLSRVYIYHDDVFEPPEKSNVPVEKINNVKELALASWAAGRI